MEYQLNFGAIHAPKKEEDVLLASFAPIPTPDTYMPEYTFEAEMQNQTPSCGAHAGQSCKHVLEGFRGSPEWLWKTMRLTDHLSPDTGSTMDTIMGVLKNQGICDFALMPNNANVSNAEYASPNGLLGIMTEDALNHKIPVYAFSFNPTFQQIKDAIFQHKAVILEMEVGAEYWTDKNGNGSWQAKDIFPLRDNVPITSGHFITAYGFDQNYIYFINSWSPAWGQNGRGWFGSDYSHRTVRMGSMIDVQNNTYVFTKTLRQGNTGFDVKQLQRVLNLTQDGIFGPHTLQAVKIFQGTHKLIPDGVVGPKTNAVLNTL